MTIQNPEDLVVLLVKKIRNKYSKELHGEDLARQVCGDYNRTVKELALGADYDGFHSPDKKCVVLNKSCTYKPRYLFTFFHEITHFLITEEGHEIIEILTNHSRSNYSKSLEKLCDLGAVEFMLPDEDLKLRIQKDGSINIGFFNKLITELTDLSAPALARKLASAADYAGIFVICSERNINNNDGLINTMLCVEYAFNTHSFKWHLKIDHPVTDHHLLIESYVNKQDLTGEDYFPFSNMRTKMPCFIEAICRNNRVYAILYSKRPFNTKNQISLF